MPASWPAAGPKCGPTPGHQLALQRLGGDAQQKSAYRTCVAAARVPRGIVARALFWDTADPYYYVRLQELPGADYDLLVVGGENHKTGEATDPEAHLRCPK